MAELTTIARPYAQAVFDLARDTHQLSEWSAMLRFIEEVYANPEIQTALANPRLTRQDIERLLLAICGEKLNNAARNLLIVLVRNDRLTTLPEIATLYERLKEQFDRGMDLQAERMLPPRGHALPGDREDTVYVLDAEVLGAHARDVHVDEERVVGLEDVGGGLPLGGRDEAHRAAVGDFVEINLELLGRMHVT